MLKRLLDIIIASIALILLSPLYFYVAHKVKKKSRLTCFVSSGTPGFTRQTF